MSSLLDRFTSPVDFDTFVSALNPLWARALIGRVEQITRISATAASIRIRPSRGWKSHRPGQYVTLGVDVNGIRNHRCYSITSLSAPGDRCIEIAVQAVPDGLVSQKLVFDTKVGDYVQLSEPLGDFTLPESAVPMLFIAGGSGITPILGMIRSLANEHPTQPVTLIHYALDGDRALFAHELDALAREHEWFTYRLILNGESGEMLTESTLDEVCADWHTRRGYACGPTPMLDTAEALWGEYNLTDRLVIERFVVSPITFASEPADGTTATIAFAKSGTRLTQCKNTTLLESAEAAGVPNKAGCRAGVCHTCATQVIDGSAIDLRDGRMYEPGDTVQTCIAVATTNLILDL